MKTIYCMSIKEPHASLFLHGLKHYETRNKYTSYRGEIYIVTSKQYGDDENLNSVLIKELGYKPNILGMAIFKAVLTDCIRITPEFIKTLSDTEIINGYYDRRYALKLENITPVKPFKVRGMPSIPYKAKIE